MNRWFITAFLQNRPTRSLTLEIQPKDRQIDVSKWQRHDASEGLPEHWQQTSFILFDLGVMNLFGGAGAAFFYSLPLYALGFRYSSFWLGAFFILVGLVSWKVGRLPIVVPIAVIAAELWDTFRLLPQYDLALGVVLVQVSFVLPLVLMLISILRVRLKLRSVRKRINSSSFTVSTGKEALALLSSMLVSVGVGLATLLLFANYGLPALSESTNPLINIFHDLLVVPVLLVLFPLGAAFGEFIWLRAFRFYLSGKEISLFIRYLKQIPLIANLLEIKLAQDRPSSTNQNLLRKRLLFAVVPLLFLASFLILLRVIRAPQVPNAAEASQESAAPPGTLVVSQNGRGQYVSINAAVAEAPTGATILVRAGVYRESVVIDKDITLTGEPGDPHRVTVECAEDGCIKITAPRATVRNLNVRAQLGLVARLLTNLEPSGVLMLSGRSIIEECDISSDSGAGIIVSGSSSEPQIKNSRIHHCKLIGILFTNQSRGLVENSDIYENKWAGVRSEMGSHPIFRRSRIHHGGMDGILVDLQGAASFEDSEIFENNYAGVHARGGSFLSLIRCRILRQNGGGIFVHDQSSIKVEQCDISENSTSGIEVADQSDAGVLNSLVHHEKKAGIVVWRNSTATVEGSTIFENGTIGLLVASGGKPVVRKSIFRSHIYSAIEVTQGGDPLIEQSQIYGGRSSGIYFYQGGMGRVQECSVFGNMASNVVIASGSNPQIHKSNLSESGYAGLLVLEGGQGSITDCKIFNNYLGIEIKENSTLLVQDCAIRNNRQQGLIADSTSGGSITGSELVGNAGGAWKIEDGSRLERDGYSQ